MWGRVAQPRRTIYVSRNREVGVPTERRDGRARHPPYTKIWATSSVVERVTDNDEVGSSILPLPTMQIFVWDELTPSNGASNDEVPGPIPGTPTKV